MAAMLPKKHPSIPIMTPQRAKIEAMLLNEAPIDWRIAISLFLSCTKRTKREMMLEQATIKMMEAMIKSKIRSL